MIGITQRAIEALVNLKASAEIRDPRIGLRLAPDNEGQLQLFVDSEKEGDQIVESGGSNLLLIGEELIDNLSGATIDYRATPTGPQLVLDRPSSRVHKGNGNGRSRSRPIA